MKAFAFAALLGVTTLGFAAPAFAEEGPATATIAQAAAALAPNRFVWADPQMAAVDPVIQPVTVVVSLPMQRAYVYRGDTMIAAASVSTGKDGKDTPVGIFPILQKREMHRSNLYNSAPMPFMQRLTWDGVALHAGNNPGFPDSHGCIRLPSAFAKKLFSITTVGTNVIVTDQMVGDHLDPALLDTEASQANQAQLASLAR
ncbi:MULTISPECIES: L,D-transpeptidase family protein [unclassified Sphingomonas]|uniref:L,D-transpeptidase family protein n=1 Tax=unclassified Sphingomonas TaxID=196159 RepID=UPI0028622251|nr:MULTISPECIES: L,D-transpeptidase family protein [unclassified Sphingomonas]MDR6113961.1 lipoprotein-anchoring transpeptidase ErfK/SrfK [Sphingomonas sp. SORGH_AS_0789]MDR6148679.1 lipoprotein-anchoring transpeptidase ErfK/SrfK [Sphingomonas sp. SORGH_AS_0742]